MAGDPGEGEDRGRVLFADRTGIRSDQVTGRTWDAKGCTPVKRRTGRHFSDKAMVAISAKGRMHFMVLTESSTPTSCAAPWSAWRVTSTTKCTSSWGGVKSDLEICAS
ncbi:transposase [Streptomyces sp. NPDC046915]|uniref:transposase n=1 Tax=Streptomyces sp. NPDC046915 TaxID=3155257 RepID=UPI0033EFCC43